MAVSMTMARLRAYSTGCAFWPRWERRLLFILLGRQSLIVADAPCCCIILGRLGRKGWWRWQRWPKGIGCLAVRRDGRRRLLLLLQPGIAPSSSRRCLPLRLRWAGRVLRVVVAWVWVGVGIGGVVGVHGVGAKGCARCPCVPCINDDDGDLF